MFSHLNSIINYGRLMFHICEFPQNLIALQIIERVTWRNNSSTRYSFSENGAKNIVGNYKIFPVVARTGHYYYWHYEGVSRAAEFPSRTEETAVHRGNLSHVASGHRRCVIHERGINRKLKIVITRRFRSLTVISTDTYRPAYFRHAKTRRRDSGREVSLYICHYRLERYTK